MLFRARVDSCVGCIRIWILSWFLRDAFGVIYKFHCGARVAELADALDSGSSG